jgi:hypothetical protein
MSEGKIKIKIIGHMDFFYCKTFPLDLTACRREENKNNSQLFKTKPGLIIQIETKY